MTAAKVDLLNTVANRTEVRAGIAPGYEVLECSSFFANPHNVMLGDARGVVLFFHTTGAVYEMHYLLTDALRGNAGFVRVKAALGFMFTRHHASLIWGATPRENRAARMMNRALGARPVGEHTDYRGRTFIKYALEREAYEFSRQPVRQRRCADGIQLPQE